MSNCNDTGESRQDIIDAIHNLRTLINSGATMHTVDGQTTTFDVSSARKRLTELENKLGGMDDCGPKRPMVFSVNLSGRYGE